jgi:predicted DNA-binding transcriptional regulator AlpA
VNNAYNLIQYDLGIRKLVSCRDGHSSKPSSGQMQLKKYEALPPNLPPRGLCREAAASYIGISAGKFDELVERGQMPAAKRIDSRKVWDRNAVDQAFESLPVSDKPQANPWDTPR